jgi:hypothetical protein
MPHCSGWACFAPIRPSAKHSFVARRRRRLSHAHRAVSMAPGDVAKCAAIARMRSLPVRQSPLKAENQDAGCGLLAGLRAVTGRCRSRNNRKLGHRSSVLSDRKTRIFSSPHWRLGWLPRSCSSPFRFTSQVLVGSLAPGHRLRADGCYSNRLRHLALHST